MIPEEMVSRKECRILGGFDRIDEHTNEDFPVEVSVVVLSYNHEKYISQCLDSILAQKVNFKYEIVIGDDASTDKTPEIISDYIKRHPDITFRPFLRSQNIGASRNAYELSMNIKGRFYAYLEGDDFWCCDQKLQIQYDFLCSHPQYIGCGHSVRIVDKDDRTINKKLYWISPKKRMTYAKFDGIRLPGHSSSWMRRNIFGKTSIDYSVVYQMDRNVGDRTSILYFLYYGDFYCLDKVMSCYRYIRGENAENITARYSSRELPLYNEYKLLQNLVVFTEQVIKKRKKFVCQETRMLASALLHCLKGDKRYKAVAKEIFGCSKDKFLMLLLILPMLVIKVKDKLLFLDS